MLIINDMNADYKLQWEYAENPKKSRLNNIF